MVKVGDNDQPTAVLSGPVGQDLPPTSQAAEHCALLAISHHWPQVTRIRPDFTGLLRINSAPPDILFHRYNFYAGVTLCIRGGPAWNKSHQDPSQLLDPVERAEAIANGHRKVRALLAWYSPNFVLATRTRSIVKCPRFGGDARARSILAAQHCVAT